MLYIENYLSMNELSYCSMRLDVALVTLGFAQKRLVSSQESRVYPHEVSSHIGDIGCHINKVVSL